MLYILCYKGKRLGKPMEWTEAEACLKQMSRCFNGLELMLWHPGEEGRAASGQKKLG